MSHGEEYGSSITGEAVNSFLDKACSSCLYKTFEQSKGIPWGLVA